MDLIKRISLAHGEGGELTHQLIQNVFVKSFGHQKETLLDSAILQGYDQKMAITTDSFVVKPLFFQGGNIGKLAITGTVNDLAVAGAIPEVITTSFMIEEGFPLSLLQSVVNSMAMEAERAGVKIVAGDTKVIEKGSLDGLFINTTGIGKIEENHQLKPETIQQGDSVIISGTIGDHGISILSARGELGLITDVSSDCASLNHLTQELLTELDGIRIMRDPTRGGLATTLVEICEDFHCSIEINELDIPILNEVHGACDILGFDPLYLANEGKVLLIVDSTIEQRVLNILHKNELGKNARMIGKVISSSNERGKLLINTLIGTRRRLYRLSEMLLPRIC